VAGRMIARTLVVMAVAAAGLLAPAAASAGSYQVAICHDPTSGLGAPLDGVSFTAVGAGADAGIYPAGSACTPNGYLYATLDGSVPHGPGDLAAWQFTAPPGTQIAAVQAWRAFYAGPSTYYQSPLDTISTLTPAGSAAAIDSCSQAFGCASSGTDPATELASSNAIGAGPMSGVSAIDGTAICGGGQTCAPGGASVCPEIGAGPCLAANHLYALLVTLEDDTAPVAAAPTGSLVAPGTLTGSAGVTFSATDTGAGLSASNLYVDGRLLASAPFVGASSRCTANSEPTPLATPRFDWTVPCPLSGATTLTLDTSALADGAHSASLVALDAAGNSATVWAGTIHTANAPQGGSPQIYGYAKVGQALVASAGAWAPAASSVAFQWLRCNAAGLGCAPIAGATSFAYTVAPADAYRQLAVTVTAADGSGATSATSPTTGLVVDLNGYVATPQGPTLTAGAAPTIGGRAAVGAVLRAQPGTWSNGPVSFAYQWQRCDAAGLGCAAIAGATAARYTLAAADAQARVRVLVIATGPGGTSRAASDPTRVVAAAAASSTAPGAGGASPTGTRAANGAGACRAATLTASVDGARTSTVRLGAAASVRGTLRCGSRAITGAQVDLAIGPPGGPIGRRVHVRTGSAGAFAYVLAAGPSRRIAVSYRAFRGDATPAATAATTLRVRPLISLSITPARTSNGHTITFTGTVAGGHQPPGGVTLDVEYREGRRWMIYDTTRTRPADGAFAWRYTFRRTTQPITYWFRVAIPASGVSGYPFAATASAPRAVHVVP